MLSTHCLHILIITDVMHLGPGHELWILARYGAHDGIIVTKHLDFKTSSNSPFQSQRMHARVHYFHVICRYKHAVLAFAHANIAIVCC
jgi:hypothetical protein